MCFKIVKTEFKMFMQQKYIVDYTHIKLLWFNHSRKFI